LRPEWGRDGKQAAEGGTAVTAAADETVSAGSPERRSPGRITASSPHRHRIAFASWANNAIRFRSLSWISSKN